MEAKIDGLVTLLKSKQQPSLNNEVVGCAPDTDPTKDPNVPPTPTSTEGMCPSVPSIQVRGRDGRSSLIATLMEDNSGSMRLAGSNNYRIPETRPSFGINPSPDEAEVLLNRFRQMIPYFPFMVLPTSTSARDLIRDRPFLYHCIMAASCRIPARQIAFGEEMMQYLGEQMLVKGEKSLDLLLGILTYVGWFANPTVHFFQDLSRGPSKSKD